MVLDILQKVVCVCILRLPPLRPCRGYSSDDDEEEERDGREDDESEEKGKRSWSKDLRVRAGVVTHRCS